MCQILPLNLNTNEALNTHIALALTGGPALWVLSLWVIQLCQSCIHSIGIWAFQNEMLQKPY